MSLDLCTSKIIIVFCNLQSLEDNGLLFISSSSLVITFILYGTYSFLTMVCCASGDYCQNPGLNVYPEKHSCAVCKKGVHAPCAREEIADADPPDNLICRTCFAATDHHTNSDSVVAVHVRQPSTTATRSPVDLTRYITMGSMKYIVPNLKGTF